MRIDSSGNVGIGTTSPSTYAKFAIFGTKSVTTYGNVSAIFSDGATGSARFHHASGDVKLSSDVALAFGTGTSATERMRIDTSGSMKVPGIYGQALSGTIRSVIVRNDGYLGYSSSTRASKTNINPLDNIDWLYQLNPVEFNYRKTDPETNAYIEEAYEEKEYGLIAEEVETVSPELCFYDETESGNVLAGVHYQKMTALLLKAVQDLKTDNEALQLRIAALEAG
jgi:hypothetical protein